MAFAGTPGAGGRVYLIGQLAFDGGGQVAPESGTVLLGNSESGTHFWYPVPAPVPVPDAYNNFCPNYSSPLVPLDGDRYVLEVATRWDGQVCQASFARGPLLGSRTADGLAAGSTYRLTSLMSGLCLDVAGGSLDPGGNIQQWTCNGLPPQDWSLAATGDGTSGVFSLTSRQSNLCLTVAGAAAPGANVVQQPCDGSAAQAWAPAEVGLFNLRAAPGQRPRGRPLPRRRRRLDRCRRERPAVVVQPAGAADVARAAALTRVRCAVPTSRS